MNELPRSRALEVLKRNLYSIAAKQQSIELIYPDTLPTFSMGQVALSGLFPVVRK